MLVESLPVAMRRWRAAISRCLAVSMLLAYLHVVPVSSQNIYTFSESSVMIRICPVVEPSPNPSFTIMPSSSNNDFLIGEYTYSISGDQSQYFILSPENRMSCVGDFCTEQLSIRYDIGSPSTQVPGSFTVHYVGSNGSGEVTIQIEYATKGIYLQHPGVGVVLRPAGGNDTSLNQGILVYQGDLFPPFITCRADNNTPAEVVVAVDNGVISECSPATMNTGSGSQPTFHVLSYNPDLAVGQHRLYAAANGNCSSAPEERSEEFDVSFEGQPDTTTDPGFTTTSDIDGTGGTGDNLDVIIGGTIAGVVLFLAVLVAVISAVYLYQKYKRHVNKQGECRYGNGAASYVHPNHEATTSQNETGNGYLSVRPSLQCIYIGGKHYEKLEESLALCHGGVELKRLDDNNVDLVRAAVSRHDCIVYIVQDSGPEDECNAFIKELESMPSNENHRTCVFLILFKSDEKHVPDRPYYHVLTRAEDPNGDSFNSSSCAKTIVDEVKSIRGEDRHQEPAEPSGPSRTGDFPDDGGKVINVNNLTVVHTVNYLPSDKQGGDKDEDNAKEVFKKELHKWGDKIVKTIDKSEKNIREDLEVVHEEVERRNGAANGNKTVQGPSVPA